MNDEQIEYLLQFIQNKANYQVWCCCAGEWMRFSGEVILTTGELPEYQAFVTQGFGKYIDLYAVDIDDLCVTQIVPETHDTLLALGK